jgi:mannose/fructose/N-acetylgalactosamine-specific phosphotransferase system component IIC
MVDLSCRHVVCLAIFLEMAVTVMQDVRQRTRIALAPRQQGAIEKMYLKSMSHYHIIVWWLPKISNMIVVSSCRVNAEIWDGDEKRLRLR